MKKPNVHFIDLGLLVCFVGQAAPADHFGIHCTLAYKAQSAFLNTEAAE